MNLPLGAFLTIILIFGFLTGSTLFFYNKSRVVTASKSTNSTTFQGDIPQATAEQPSPIDELTKPAEPKGRLSYPANTYVVQPKETLFAIGAKMTVSWQTIKLANGLTNENSIQAGNVLIIPKVSSQTERYRINFLLNEGVATDLTIALRDKTDDDAFDPIKVAKRDALIYFGVKIEDEFTLLDSDLNQGTALVQVKGTVEKNLVGLIQPRNKGKNGFWAVLYIEHRDD